MELYEIKRILSENGNVALAKANLERKEVANFFEQVGIKMDEICKDRSGETHVAVATANYQLDENDIQEIAKKRKKKTSRTRTRQEYNKILDDMKRKQEKLEDGRK